MCSNGCHDSKRCMVGYASPLCIKISNGSHHAAGLKPGLCVAGKEGDGKQGPVGKLDVAVRSCPQCHIAHKMHAHTHPYSGSRTNPAQQRD